MSLLCMRLAIDHADETPSLSSPLALPLPTTQIIINIIFS